MLIDCVMPYPLQTADLDIAAWRDWLADCPRLRLLPGLGNFTDHHLGVAELQRRAPAYYDAGADGLNRWDTPGWLVGLNLHRPQWLRPLNSPRTTSAVMAWLHQRYLPLRSVR